MCKFVDAPHHLCVYRKCSECGVERVGRRLRECLGMNVGKKVDWSKWEYVKEGKSLRMEKVTKSGTVDECVSELLQELGPLSRHVFNAEWQRKPLQSLKKELPEGWALATCDFAENFLCRFQDEPQSAHWAYRQVTLFPVVVFSRSGCGELRRDSLVFLSDDVRHDAHLAQVCVQQVLQYLSGIVDSLKKVVLVSDGCAAQFKSKLPFLFLSHTQVLNSSKVAIEKVFFGARHSKNDCDWCRDAVKRAVARDIASERVTVRNAQDMYTHCCKVLSASAEAGNCCHKVQQFFLIEKHQLERKVNSSMLTTVPGSRKMHHLRALAPGVLATRQLSCFCSSCMLDQYQSCLAADHVDEWEIVKLKYSGPNNCMPCIGPAPLTPEKAEMMQPLPSEASEVSSDSELEIPGQFSSDTESPVVSESEWTDNEERETNQPAETDSRPQTDQPTVFDQPTETDRITFFSCIGGELDGCNTFAEVQLVTQRWKEEMKRYVLPFPSVSGNEEVCAAFSICVRQ